MKRSVLYVALLVAIWSGLAPPVAAQEADDQSLMVAIKLNTPRETMRTFLTAMHDYVDGMEQGNDALRSRLQDAVACLDLSEVMPPSLREEKGREAAILLKEVMDRLLVINYDSIPDDAEDTRWSLRGSGIQIVRQREGPREGEYLFASQTVMQAQQLYHEVRDQPYLPGLSGAGYRPPWIEQHVPPWARERTLEVANWQWLGLFLAILLGLIIRVVVHHVLQMVKKVVVRTQTRWDDLLVESVERPVSLLAAGAFWYFAIHLLRFDGMVLVGLIYLVQIIVSIAVIWLLYKLADVLTEYLQTLTAKTESTLDDHLVPLLRRALRIFVIIFGVLFTVQNMGFNVLSVLAGLGLGGLAFALAAKDTCANFFGSLMIFLDRPFQIGDWIIVGSNEGTVEEIGFRSTRIRTFYNSVISIPNSVMANANIDNMGRREYRRIKAFFGLTYDTPPEKMEAFLEGMKNIVKANPNTRKDYYHVVFNGYGDFSLEVMLYCFLKVPDWSAELVERQNIYLEILRLAREVGVEFAFPTQTLHMESFPEKESLRAPHSVDAAHLRKGAAAFGPDGSLSKPGGQGLFTPPYKEHS